MKILKYSDAIYSKPLDGLRINPLQTFGIEFELTSSVLNLDDDTEWKRGARALINILVDLFGSENVNQTPVSTNLKKISYLKWNVVFDRTCGWEIVTPVLKGENGFETIVDLLRGLTTDDRFKQYKFKVGSNTGTHVHFGWDYGDPKRLKKIIQFMRKYEAAFFTILSPSRFGNDYCMPIISRFGDDEINQLRGRDQVDEMLSDDDLRYSSLNLLHYNKTPPRIEVRMHSGTLNASKILLWVAIWMNVFHVLEDDDFVVNRFKADDYLPEIKRSSRCDLVSICHQELGMDGGGLEKMLEKIHSRRKSVFGNKWWRDNLGEEEQKRFLKYWDNRFSEKG